MNNYCGNKRAFALIMAMGLTLIMGLLAYFILDYMVPFAKNTKGIENASRAYYQAESAVEDALYYINRERLNVGSESGSILTTGPLGYNFAMQASGSLLPPSGEGNSEFDSDWNRIRSGEPIQLEVGDNMVSNWSTLEFYFRVPDLDGDNDNTDQTLSGSSTPIINWQLVSESDVLNASGSWIIESEINGAPINFNTKNGKNLDETTDTFSSFYSSNCGTSKSCTLKLSIINKLELNSNNTPVPYLEWYINTNSQNIPLRYTVINSSGKSYGFKKDLKVKIPQQTVNEAFDFTVFQ